MSVLRIYQNPLAINSLRNLKITGSAISKSLERLSSGLRINRAADDAAGLSISEKLRAQIRGLNRASSNALDGISLIQTAEGALNEVHAILQRMRELSVQAANGIYTANDRSAIQLEVSQLVDEINRISDTTEFNTKTLLDGTMGALISTDDYTKVRASVTGNVGKGGNFVMKAVALTTGQLQVQKTDVFATTLEKDAVGQLNYMHTWRADATIVTADASGIGQTGVYQIEVPYSVGVGTPPGETAVNSTVDGVLTISAAVGSTSAYSIGRNLQAEEITVGDRILITYESATLGVETVSVTIQSLGTTNAVLAQQISAASAGFANNVNFDSTYGGAPPDTGNNFSINLAAGTRILSTRFIDTDESGSDFYLSFSENGQSNRFFISFFARFQNNGATVGANMARAGGAAGATGPRFSIGDANTGTINVRFDTRFDWSQVSLANSTLSDTIAWNRYTGGNSLQEYGRVWQDQPAVASGTYLVSAISARTYAVYSFDNTAYTSLVAGGMDQNVALAASRRNQQSDINGNTVFSISSTFVGATGSSLENIKLTFDGILQRNETATFNVSANNVLTGDQLNTLASLNRFQEFGVFNGRNNVELTVYLRGTAHQATVNLTENDTFEDMAGKISLAIWSPDQTGVVNSGIINPQEPPDLVHVNTVGMAKGTMSITTPVPGQEIVFAGDESLLKALSLVEIVQGISPVYSVSAFNLEQGVSVGSVTTDSNEIIGLLPGLKVFFDNTLGLKLDPEPPGTAVSNSMTSFAYPLPIERPVISLSGSIDSFFIHVAPRDFTLQVGANQGQTISSYIGDMSAQALGVDGILVVSSELAQEAISTIDVAISNVSAQRSRLGALQNRLESTIRNLDVAAENLTSSESRIRDVDVALETVVLTRNQILLQAGVSALAQANSLPQSVLQLLS